MVSRGSSADALALCRGALVGCLFVWYAQASSPATAVLTVAVLALSARRPSPAALIALLAVSYLYVLLVLFATLTPRSALVQALHAVDSSFRNAPVAPDVRTEDCALSVRNLHRALDFYALAHILGYTIKGAMLRDRAALWVSSVAFEVVEYGLAAAAPAHFSNLAECAWDTLALDLLVTNVLGMELGLAVSGGALPLAAPAARTAVAVAAGLLVAATDALHFSLIAALRLDTASPLLSARMALFASLGFQATRQLRRWCRTRGRLFAPHLCVMAAALVAEAVFCALRLPETRLRLEGRGAALARG
jgi:hypothetical protein